MKQGKNKDNGRDIRLDYADDLSFQMNLKNVESINSCYNPGIHRD